MVATVGKKLQEARVAQGISIEDASRATKMRPERIIELERDDLKNFPNLAYARGFLLIYAKFLGLDISGYATSPDSNQAGLDDYEYLAHAPVTTRTRIIRRTPRRSPMPWIVAATILIVGAIVWSFLTNFKRLGDLDHLTPDGTTPTAAEAVPPIPAKPALVAPVATPTPAALSVDALTTNPSDRLPVPSTPPEAAIPPRADPVLAVAPADEVVLQPLRKIWVKVQRGSRESTPIFEDYLYPGTRPLTLHGGGKFWIEIGETGAVEIRKNGAVIAYQPPGILIE